MITRLRLRYPLSLLCRTLEVSESGYYAHISRPPSKRALEDQRLLLHIKAAHKQSKETYGPVRLQDELRDNNVHVGVSRIRRLRTEHGIRCKQKKKFKATTDSNHKHPVARNLLNRKFTVDAPDKVWVTDITYIYTSEGWLYLTGLKDLCTGEIVGYAMGSRMTQELVSNALFRAVAARRPEKGLIHHSDRGSQYCSKRYRKLLKQFGMKASMSRKGDCWDNAPMESFWGTLKQELVHHRKYKTREEAIREITEYIEVFYNRQRKQKRLGFLSPAAFEKQLRTNSQAA